MNGLGRQLAVVVVVLAAAAAGLAWLGFATSAVRTTMDGDRVARADAYASGSAQTMTGYLGREVVHDDAAPTANLVAVQRWFADPAKPYLQWYAPPAVQVLASDAGAVEVVLREHPDVAAFGDDRAWGYACLRYAMTAAKQLQATEIPCPVGTSREPATP